MRLINADAIAYESIDSCDTGRHEHYYGTGIIAVRKEDIDAMPTIQPDIVRCKDCKYAEYIDDVQTLWCTECGQGRTVAPNDFCSYAERRDDEH